MSRRGALALVGGMAATVTALTVGETLSDSLRPTALLSPRGQSYGDGPTDFQVNRTASAAGITPELAGDAWTLQLLGPTPVTLTRAQLLALPQHTAELPIACVEGWSTVQTWTGVRLRDLVAMAGDAAPGSALVTSLERNGAFARAVLGRQHLTAPDALLALQVNGVDLSPDHGYPARVIAPSLPGVHNTKWVRSIEVRRVRRLLRLLAAAPGRRRRLPGAGRARGAARARQPAGAADRAVVPGRRAAARPRAVPAVRRRRPGARRAGRSTTCACPPCCPACCCWCSGRSSRSTARAPTASPAASTRTSTSAATSRSSPCCSPRSGLLCLVRGAGVRVLLHRRGRLHRQPRRDRPARRRPRGRRAGRAAARRPPRRLARAPGPAGRAGARRRPRSGGRRSQAVRRRLPPGRRRRARRRPAGPAALRRRQRPRHRRAARRHGPRRSRAGWCSPARWSSTARAATPARQHGVVRPGPRHGRRPRRRPVRAALPRLRGRARRGRPSRRTPRSTRAASTPPPRPPRSTWRPPGPAGTGGCVVALQVPQRLRPADAARTPPTRASPRCGAARWPAGEAPRVFEDGAAAARLRARPRRRPGQPARARRPTSPPG